MAKTLLAILAAAVFAAPVTGADQIRLDNGATLIVDPIPGTGAVSVIASYATGYADDPAGLAQAAHLAEHLRVTSAIGDDPPGANADRLNTLGAANAETLAALTYYDFALPPDQLALAFATEAARLTALKVTDADIAREIPRVRAEVDSVAGSPGLFVGKFAAMAAAQCWLHDAAEAGVRLTRPPDADTMRRFIDDHHRVDRLTLTVTGDVDPQRAAALFREHLGPIAKPAHRAAPASRDFAGLPALRRVGWDVPAKVVLIAMPGSWAESGVHLQALATRATFALNQKELVRSTVSSGPTVPVGGLPLFVGVCLHPDADEDEALALLHDALDAALATDPAQTRGTAAFIAFAQPRPDAGTVRDMAARFAAQRGMEPHVAGAMIMGNHALQSVLRVAPGGPTDDALTAATREAFARDNRRVLILDPPKAE